MSSALEQPGIRLRAGDLIALRAHALTGPGMAEHCATLPGGHATRAKGQGIEVADIRDYLPGDDIRHLDRASTARTGKLHVRQFQAERDRVRYLVADMRSEMLWGLRRALLSVAAAEALVLDAWPLIEDGGRAGLLAVTDRDVTVVPPRGRIRGMLDVIGGLVEAHAEALTLAKGGGATGALSLDRALHRLERLAPSGSEIVIASGFDAPGPELTAVLDALAQRRAIRLMLVSNTDALPAGRYPVRLADGRRTTLRIGARDAVPQAMRVAGREALVVDAGASPAETARGAGAISRGARGMSDTALSEAAMRDSLLEIRLPEASAWASYADLMLAAGLGGAAALALVGALRLVSQQRAQPVAASVAERAAPCARWILMHGGSGFCIC